MGKPRFTEEFKINAIKQITERGYSRCFYYHVYHDRIVIMGVLHSAQDVKPEMFVISDAK